MKRYVIIEIDGEDEHFSVEKVYTHTAEANSPLEALYAVGLCEGMTEEDFDEVEKAADYTKFLSIGGGSVECFVIEAAQKEA